MNSNHFPFIASSSSEDPFQNKTSKKKEKTELEKKLILLKQDKILDEKHKIKRTMMNKGGMGANDDDRLRREIMVRQQLANDTMLLIRHKKDYSNFTNYSKALKANKMHVHQQKEDRFGLRQVDENSENENDEYELDSVNERVSNTKFGNKRVTMDLNFPVIETLK